MPKAVLYGPVIIGIVGVACGVMGGMLTRYDVSGDRVHIERSLPLAICGFCGSALPGSAVMWLYQNRPRTRGWIEVTATALLIGSVCAVLGWLVGDKRLANPPPSMIWGLVLGLSLGALTGAKGRFQSWRSSH